MKTGVLKQEAQDNALSSRKLEVQEYYEKVENKVQTILGFRKIVNASVEQSDEEFEKTIRDYFENVKKSFPQEVLEEFYQLIEENKNFQRLYDEIMPSPGNFEYSSILGEKIFESNKKIKNLEKNTDLMFLYKIYIFVLDMIEKKYFAKKERAEEILERIGFPVNAKIIASGVNLNIFLEKDDYEKLFKNSSLGRYNRNLYCSFIKNFEDNDDTIKHENNHNIASSFDNGVIYIDNLLRSLKKDFKFLKLGLLPDDINKDTIKKIISNYYAMNFSEILADIDNLAVGKLNTYTVNYYSSGEKIKNLIKSEIKDKSIKNELLEAVTELEKNFETYFFSLGNIFFAAERMGKTEEVKGLLILFGSGKNAISKIERHLNSYDEKYDDYIFLRKFLHIQQDKFNFTLKRGEIAIDLMMSSIFGEKTTELQNYYSIKETKILEKVLKIVKNGISNEDKELIIERFEDYGTDDYFFENSDYSENIRFEEYLSIFKKILEIVCDDENRINAIIDKFKETFIIINE